VYVESGSKRVFAGAIDWPGWCRSGRDEAAALETLLAYAPRYANAIGSVGGRFPERPVRSTLRVTERLEGNATTDFGAPAIAPSGDERPIGPDELRRWRSILEASWSAFGRTARHHRNAELRTGPRGGGRTLPAIVDHVLDADLAYLGKLGGMRPGRAGAAPLRTAILEVLQMRARGEPPRRTPRSGSLWSPRYLVRRSAWHALDHAWEIEDRTTG
jgi:hypothetical protein